MTGLDATSALQIMQTLQDLSRKGRTIIVSIHQPRSEIWTLLDRVLLLSRGSPLYSGSTDAVLSYFTEQGFQIPPLVNPAEFLIDLAAIDNRTADAEVQSKARVEALASKWTEESHHFLLGDNESFEEHNFLLKGTDTNAPRNVPFVRQIQFLTDRTLKCTVRDPMGIMGSLFEASSMAVLTGWIFLNLDGSLQGVKQ